MSPASNRFYMVIDPIYHEKTDGFLGDLVNLFPVRFGHFPKYLFWPLEGNFGERDRKILTNAKVEIYDSEDRYGWLGPIPGIRGRRTYLDSDSYGFAGTSGTESSPENNCKD